MIHSRSLKEVLQKKISTRLIGGFLVVAFLVGFVGIWGILSSNTIRKNDQIAIEFIELENLLGDSLVQVLQLIETQTVDDYRDIKSNIENLRKDFDILHQKNDEFIHELDVGTFDENVQEFIKISNGILAIHNEKLIRIREFDEKVITERQLRRAFRNPLFLLGINTLTEDVGSLQYKSKEGLYQYQDQKHIEEWLESIRKVKNNPKVAQLPDVLNMLNSYERIARDLGEIVLEQKKVEDEELLKIGQLREVIDKLEENEKLLVSNMRTGSESLARNTFLILSVVILAAFIASIVLGLYIARSIAKPIGELSRTAKAIADGDLNKRVEVIPKDEIGQLAIVFNEMTAKLKESYEDLEEKVHTRTKELEEEKIKASHEKDKIATILYSIGDGVFVVDSEYRIVMFNKVAAMLSGFSIEEAMGKRYDSILKFVLEKNEKVNDTFIKDAIDTGEVKEMTNHTALIKKDGSKIPVADSAAPIKDKDGIIVGCVVVFRDITKEREIDRAKSEFVSLASHQLRTPLSSINWYTEMLLAGDAGRVTKEQKKYLAKVSHGSQRMAQLVSALLNVSRLELGTLALEPEPINLKRISEGALEELKLEIARKKLRVMQEYDSTLPAILLDPEVIQIVFQNVLSNAVKYTPEGGTIQIIIGKKGKEALIAVRDTGYGIPENQQDKIFTKLFRADNVRARDTDGTGLGLYIAQAIVKEAGGKIWFESKENKGTTFYITLPLAGMKRREGTKGLTTSSSS